MQYYMCYITLRNCDKHRSIILLWSYDLTRFCVLGSLSLLKKRSGSLHGGEARKFLGYPHSEEITETIASIFFSCTASGSPISSQISYLFHLCY